MGSLTAEANDTLDPWRSAVHLLPSPKGKPAPPDEFGQPTDVPFDDLEHLLLIWAEPTGKTVSDGIKVRGCIIDVASCPRAIREFEANLNGGASDTISLSSGMLTIDMHWLRRGIASLALERLVEWAKRYHSHKRVAKYNIGPYSDEKQDYLRRLYGTFGFSWSVKRIPEDESVWKSNAMGVNDLKKRAASEPGSGSAAADCLTAYVDSLRVSLSEAKAALRVADRKNESRKLSISERLFGVKEDNSSSKRGSTIP